MTDIVERAKSALDGVTGGPWQWERSTLTGGPGAYDEILTPGPVDCAAYCYGGSSVIESDNPEYDRAFIAAARTLVPELVAEVERLRAILDRVTELAHRWEAEAATTWDGRKDIIAGAYGGHLLIELGVNETEATE